MTPGSETGKLLKLLVRQLTDDDLIIDHDSGRTIEVQFIGQFIRRLDGLKHGWIGHGLFQLRGVQADRLGDLQDAVLR